MAPVVSPCIHLFIMPHSCSGQDKGKEASKSNGHSRPDPVDQALPADKEGAQTTKCSKATERQELRRDWVLEKICAQSLSKVPERQGPQGEWPDIQPGPSTSLNISDQLALDSSNLSVHSEALWEAPMVGTSAEVPRSHPTPGPTATFTPTATGLRPDDQSAFLSSDHMQTVIANTIRQGVEAALYQHSRPASVASDPPYQRNRDCALPFQGESRIHRSICYISLSQKPVAIFGIWRSRGHRLVRG